MKSKHLFKPIHGACAGIVLALFSLSAHAVPVSLELALLVDVSGSVDSNEYNLQQTGYVNAFQDAGIQSSIAGLTNGIAVSYIEWSSATAQAKLVDWTHITDASSANAFASAIQGTTRSSSGLTAVGSAINFGASELLNNGFEGNRMVLDVSGDGANNDGVPGATARDTALAAGIDTINGLPIGSTSVYNYYSDNVIGGTNAFVVQAASFQDFQNAVVTKIGREIAPNPVPLPATLPLLGIGLAGLVAFRRKEGRG